MIPCPNNLVYEISAPYQHLLQLVNGTTKKTYAQDTNQDGLPIFWYPLLKFHKANDG